MTHPLAIGLILCLALAPPAAEGAAVDLTGYDAGCGVKVVVRAPSEILVEWPVALMPGGKGGSDSYRATP